MRWLTPAGDEMATHTGPTANTRCFGMLLDGRAQVSAIPRPGTDASVLLVFNGWHEGVEFALPPVPGGGEWTRLFDTALDEQSAAELPAGEHYVVTGRSIVAMNSSGAGDTARSDG